MKMSIGKTLNAQVDDFACGMVPKMPAAGPQPNSSTGPNNPTTAAANTMRTPKNMQEAERKNADEKRI